jgi:hypothetical protein
MVRIAKGDEPVIGHPDCRENTPRSDIRTRAAVSYSNPRAREGA